MQVERHKEPTGCTFVLKAGDGTLLASCQVIGSRSVYFDGQLAALPASPSLTVPAANWRSIAGLKHEDADRACVGG